MLKIDIISVCPCGFNSRCFCYFSFGESCAVPASRLNVAKNRPGSLSLSLVPLCVVANLSISFVFLAQFDFLYPFKSRSFSPYMRLSFASVLPLTVPPQLMNFVQILNLPLRVSQIPCFLYVSVCMGLCGWRMLHQELWGYAHSFPRSSRMLLSLLMLRSGSLWESLPNNNIIILFVCIYI